jgi:hypothetical protein
VPARPDRLFRRLLDRRFRHRLSREPRLIRCGRDRVGGIRRVVGQDRGRLQPRTPAALSQAVGVQYTAITGAGSLCTVKGPGSASFDYTVAPESAANTWSEQVSTIKGDDGQAVSEPGIGDRAVWGGEEFAAEADGYIVGVIGAEFPSTAQGSGFFRTGKIAKLLISKL